MRKVALLGCAALGLFAGSSLFLFAVLAQDAKVGRRHDNDFVGKVTCHIKPALDPEKLVGTWRGKGAGEATP